MDLYDEVKQLFDFSEDTIDIYFNLQARLLGANNNLLVICKNELSLNKIHGDVLKNITNSETDKNIVVKTIEECKKLEGYKFKKIIFYD